MARPKIDTATLTRARISSTSSTSPLNDANGPSATRTCSPTSKLTEGFGRSTPSCVGPLGIGLAAPARPGAGALFTCFNGPPSTTGALVVGSAPNPTGVPYLGATLHVSQVPAPTTIPVTTDEGGYAEVRLRIPPTTAADEPKGNWIKLLIGLLILALVLAYSVHRLRRRQVQQPDVRRRPPPRVGSG